MPVSAVAQSKDATPLVSMVSDCKGMTPAVTVGDSKEATLASTVSESKHVAPPAKEAFFTCLLKNAPADALDLDSEDECAELFGSTQEQYHGPTQEPAGGLAVVSRRR